MEIKKFRITNYKGIHDTSISISDGAPGNIITLIGLNESGKTTILEAISHFITEDKETSEFVGTASRKSELFNLIPKDKKAAFTGSVKIEAQIIVSDKEIGEFVTFMREQKDVEVKRDTLNNSLEVSKVYSFEDSKLKLISSQWSFIFDIKKKRGKKYIKCDDSNERDLWIFSLNFFKERVPKIVYFPTFLFNFPDRIYLDGKNDNKNQYYKNVFQDILDRQGENLNIEKHIIDRINSIKTECESNGEFLSKLIGSDIKAQIDAVFRKAANEVSKVIFGSWNEVLGKHITGKRVEIEWYTDPQKDFAPYLEFCIVDGQSKYSLSERSLGFRWFFSFLLFTEFRKNRKQNSSTIFLFDEPAANLHSKAQMKLLDSFSQIANTNNYIVYSTHSHYMINPLWLEKSYIIENSAINYNNDEDIESFSCKKTSIKAQPYPNFVGSHPNKITYFQPVLDAIDVTFSKFIPRSEALIVEGKNDYFPLVYFYKKIIGENLECIFPSNGAGSIGPLISIFRGWGINFRILLDGDNAGHIGKNKYEREYFLNKKDVICLDDISPSLSGQAFESLYKEDVSLAIKKYFNVDTLKKFHYSLFFQSLLSEQREQNFPETEKSIMPILEWIQCNYKEKT